MAFGSTFQNDLLKLLFNGTAIANVADNASVAPTTNLWLSLHTADPSGGTQGTNETTSYTGYARVGVARTSTGFSVGSTATNVVALALNVDFGQMTAGTSQVAAYAGIGLSSATTSGKLITSGPITPNISITLNVIPRLTTASTFTLT